MWVYSFLTEKFGSENFQPDEDYLQMEVISQGKLPTGAEVNFSRPTTTI